MKDISTFPRFPLAHRPTPLEPLNNIAREVGRSNLYIKRDDCTGLALGGNKARKLEFYVGDALARGATTLLTTGAIQSNYLRCTAAAAAKAGLKCVLQLEDRLKDAPDLYRESGNVLLNQIFGAHLVMYHESDDEAGADKNLQVLAEELRKKGERPYVIPLGVGPPPLGALGYVETVAELLEQEKSSGMRISEIVVASGSAQTHAGLLVGLEVYGRPEIIVSGSCVRRGAAEQAERVLAFVRATEVLLELPVLVPPKRVVTTDRYLGPGYGRITPDTRSAVLTAARLEGLVLDPVYTAKSFALFLDLAHSKPASTDGTLVFLHTGGAPAVFGYGMQMLE